jgi:hypothetical protein
MDSFFVTAGVVVLLTAILHGSKRMSDFIDGLCGASKDIATLSTDLQAFYDVPGVLTSMQDELLRNSAFIRLASQSP